MTDSKALIERLREWPMREQVQTYDHTFHIAETGSSYTTKRVIPQSPKPAMHEAADHIKKLEADNAQMRGALDDAFAQMVDTFADPDRLKNSTLAMDAFCDAMERCRAALAKSGLEVREIEG